MPDGLFFPQAQALGLEVAQTFSPALTEKITYLASQMSFPQASNACEILLDLPIPTKPIQRLTERIAQEFLEENDQDIHAFEQLTLTQKIEGPPDVVAPSVCAVMIDGGRHQQVEGNPKTNNHWYEFKSGICVQLDSQPSQTDPMPNVPDFLLDYDYAEHLSSELGKKAAIKPEFEPVLKLEVEPILSLGDLEPAIEKAQAQAEQKAGEAKKTVSAKGKSQADTDNASVANQDESAKRAKKSQEKQRLSPPVIEREVVATQRTSLILGLLIAFRAWTLGFFRAERKAFVADGMAYNWTIYEERFKPFGFVGILDIIHATTYIFAAATAGRTKEEGAVIYNRWISWVWAGEVSKVIEELNARVLEVGEPEEDESETSVRNIVLKARRYLENQKNRMDYPNYRREGLPLTSAHMESTIKEINRRIKGSEKFWNEENAEGMLNFKAATLSDSQPMKNFWKAREERQSGFYRWVGKHPPKKAA